MSPTGIGVFDFQLYLLKVMDPPSSLLEGALDLLGADEETMRDRAGRISKILQPRFGMSLDVREILDEARVEIEDSGSTKGSHIYCYRLSVWPDFEFRIQFDPSSQFILQAAFYRIAMLELHAPRELEPWKFLRSDVRGTFSNVQEVDKWGHYETCVTFDTERRRRLFLRFAWSMLQEVELM